MTIRAYLEPWVWLLGTFPVLLFLQRWISRHMQIIFLLLTRHAGMAMLLNQLVFLPGVLLHEFSHWVLARLLGVRTMGFSVWPMRQADGSLRLGYVHTQKVDFVREALVGAAPLLAGCAAVVAIGLRVLELDQVALAFGRGDWASASGGLVQVLQSTDLLIWVYVLFALSNTMMPSASDRRAWPLVGGLLLALGAGLYYLGMGPVIQGALGEGMAAGVRVMATAFTVTIGVDLAMLPAILGAEWLLRQLHPERRLERLR
jgi:hypothetical protein